MTVAVAHQAASASRLLALQTGLREAALRKTDLAVIHVVGSLDLDVEDAYRNGIDEEIKRAARGTDTTEVAWQIHLITDTGENVANAILETVIKTSSELVVIGARRRSPVGKALLGSVTQSIILGSDVSVLVVKGS